MISDPRDPKKVEGLELIWANLSIIPKPELPSLKLTSLHLKMDAKGRLSRFKLGGVSADLSGAFTGGVSFRVRVRKLLG